ncbi:hypothetical protein Q3G72_020008 [Acer saccharum]|nr:hypothetical protein Q3G72_020008 [Acer saccharum]
MAPPNQNLERRRAASTATRPGGGATTPGGGATTPGVTTATTKIGIRSEEDGDGGCLIEIWCLILEKDDDDDDFGLGLV